MTMSMINPEIGTFTAKANVAITAGQFVKIVSSDDVVTSAGTSSYAWDDIVVEDADDASSDYLKCCGIAGNDAAAGQEIVVYTKGLFIVRSAESITAGQAVQMSEDTDEFEVDGMDSTSSARIGRALTGASAGDKYVLLLLRIGY